MHECGGQRPLQILLIAVLSSAANDSRNILHWYIYIMKENHTVVPHNLIWIKTGLIKLSWVGFDIIGFLQWGTISSLHMALFVPSLIPAGASPGFLCPSVWGSGTHRCWCWDVALMPSSDAVPDSALLLFQGKLKAFLLGVGKPLAHGIVGRRQNLLGNAAGKRENMKNLV